MNNEKNMVIFSQYLAGQLMVAGCRLKKIKPDKKDCTKFVYFFENTELVRNYVSRYMSEKTKRKDESYE
jgi:hypothetical protein